MLTTKKYVLLLALVFISNISSAQYVTKKNALEDLNQFKNLLEKRSSYYQVSNFDFAKRYKKLEKIISSKDSLPIYFLAFEFEKIIAKTVDRHANIRMKSFNKSKYKMSNQHLPFALSYLNGNIVAIRYNKAKKKYEHYSKKYPYLKQIDGINIYKFLDQYAYRRKLSPYKAKISDGLRDLRNIGELYFKQGKSINKIRLTLTNGKKDKKIVLPLSNQQHKWVEIEPLRVRKKFGKSKNFDLSKLNKWVNDSIAYLAIPTMLRYKKHPYLETYFINTIEKFRGAKALIVDIRGNEGGTREILNTLSGYFIQPAQSPWVANVAYIRSNQYLNKDISSMRRKFLYNYNSSSLSDNDRAAIDKFNKNYKAEYDIDVNKFSHPFYMVLHSSQAPLKCPIYILVNEKCFSAASVFTSAFKGLPNVKIVGINTNGSSGRSKKFYLKHSNIRVKISTMLSFQRNGKTLDGNGTKPDIVIDRDENQVLEQTDSQLQKLIELIKNN